MRAADIRTARRRKASMFSEAKDARRDEQAQTIAAEAQRLLDVGVADSLIEARRLARCEALKADLAIDARRKLPNATDLGIQRHVVKKMDIIDALHARSDAVESRLSDGYLWEGGNDPATGRERAPFIYAGLRSDEHPLLKMFASCLPKARSRQKECDETELRQALMAGKKEYTRAAGSKLLGLDLPYIDGQKSVRGFIRIDCDGVFPSWDILRLALADVFDSFELLPHIAVADELSDGRILRPHLIWLLPPNSRIRFDAKALPKPQRFFHAIAHALTAAIVPLGSDIGGLSNIMRVKNPLCPHWAVAILNERDPLCLSELAVGLESWLGEDDWITAERQAAVRVASFGISECSSNSFFRSTIETAWQLARQWIAEGDERARLKDDELARALSDALGHDAREALSNMPPRRVMAMLISVCRWAARRFDPNARRSTPHPEILRGKLDGLDLKGRQAAGGRHAASSRKASTIEAMRTAIKALRDEGAVVTKTAVAKRAGVALRTAQRLWDEVYAKAVVNAAPLNSSGNLPMTDGLRKIAVIESVHTPTSNNSVVCSFDSIETQGEATTNGYIFNDANLTTVTLPNIKVTSDRSLPKPSSYQPEENTNASLSEGQGIVCHAQSRQVCHRPTVDDGETDDVIMLIEQELWLAFEKDNNGSSNHGGELLAVDS